jgi:hypothetical protein
MCKNGHYVFKYAHSGVDAAIIPDYAQEQVLEIIYEIIKLYKIQPIN